MNYTFPAKDIISATLEGISDAHISCLDWTNNRVWLSAAPEYMINIHIGKQLSSLVNKPNILFEVPVTNYTSAKKVNRDGFIDIVLDNTHTEKSCVVIEVKNGISKYTKPLERDIVRICQLLEHNKDLEYGLIAFFANVNDKKSIHNLLKQIKKSTQNTIDTEKYFVKQIQINPENFIEMKPDENDGWTCAAVCFAIERQ